MKYLKQFGIILAFSFLGEVLNYILPLPVPASIYGIVLLFICLMSGLLHVEDVAVSGYFLIEIMPIMFIPATVGLINSWSIRRRAQQLIDRRIRNFDRSCRFCVCTAFIDASFRTYAAASIKKANFYSFYQNKSSPSFLCASWHAEFLSFYNYITYQMCDLCKNPGKWIRNIQKLQRRMCHKNCKYP